MSLGSGGGMDPDGNGQIQACSGWGEYQTYLGDALESCVDYVGRLQRSIEGEIPSDRHYFVEKAGALKEWVTILLARCAEIKGWIEDGGFLRWTWTIARVLFRAVAHCEFS